MRLIDADALIDRIKNPYEQAQVARWVNEQPTIEPEKRTEKRTETHGVCLDAIDRQAAIDAVYKCADIFVGDMPVMVVKADAYEAIAQLPPAQPEVLACGEGELIAQPEIVRCKDCKHHGTNGCRLNCAMFCCTMPDDGFCSCGERRTDDTD